MNPPFKESFPCAELSCGDRSLGCAGGLGKGEAIADLATLGSSTGFALGAFFRSLVRAQAADFFEDAVHFEAGLEAFESAVNGLAFADLNFGHKRGRGGLGKGA